MLKLNRRITLSAAGLLGLGAIATIIGTTAFFKDTKSTTNTFTVGSVELDVKEKQRDPNADYSTTCDESNLVDFVQEKALLPFVGNEYGGDADASHFDACNMPKSDLAKNYTDKIVDVTNTGASEAWVRVYVAVPKKLDDDDASHNLLHFNFGRDTDNRKTSNSGTNTSLFTGDWLWTDNGSWNSTNAIISTKPLSTAPANTPNANIEYTIYHADYKTKLGSGETTKRLLNGVYLDSGITKIKNNANNETVITIGNTDTNIGYDAFIYGMKLPVYTVAIQADGYSNAKDAMHDAGFDYNTNPWANSEV